MNLPIMPKRAPPGPIKRYDRYFTIPINSKIFEALEALKWRAQLDKTEVTRRLIEYVLTLPPDAQDKILRSFDGLRAVEKPKKLRKQSIDKQIDHKQKEASTPPMMRVIKRSGLP